MTANARPRSRVALERLPHAPRAAWEVDWSSPVDSSLPFLCDTLTPLYYTPVYGHLTAAQRLRYNQLTGMSFNEVIAFFEESLAGSVLGTLARRADVPALLRAEVEGFRREEADHTAAFRRLNELAAPAWYGRRHDHLVRVPKRTHRLLRWIGARSPTWTYIFWVMLAMEERSLEISRRIASPVRPVEPHFAAVYLAHRRDEARHVQIDWHLIDRYHRALSPAARRVNAWLFRRTAYHLLVPKVAARRVLDALTAEFPDLRPHRRAMDRQLAALAHNPDYHRALFSREATPILFQLMDEFPEFHSLGSLLIRYRPETPVEAAA